MKIFENAIDLWIYLGIVILISTLFLLSEFFKSKKIKRFFEKMGEWIKDFFNFPF